MQGHIINFIPISERILVIQLKGNSININIVQVYVPTLDVEDAKRSLLK